MAKYSSEKLARFALVALFLLVLVLPLIEMGVRLDPTPARNENRALANMPKLPRSLAEVPDALKDFDSFISDNFGFRKLLIRLSAYLRFFVFKISPTENVLIGKSDWYYTSLQRNVELYRNVTPMTEAEVEEYILKLREREAWAQENGAQYVFVVGPDSLTLNPENLPDWVTKVNPGSRLDQLIDGARKYGFEILDLRPALLEGKSLGAVSYKTDSHWNGYGGYIAYRKIVDKLRRQNPEVSEPIPFSEYQLRHQKRPGLDLTNLMGLQDVITEDGDELYYIGKRSFRETEREHLHFTTNNPEVAEFPIAFVCDSMGGNVFPHLSRHFSTVRVLWGYIFGTEEIKRYKPKAIVDMVIERTLSLTWARTENPQEVKDALARKLQASKAP